MITRTPIFHVHFINNHGHLINIKWSPYQQNSGHLLNIFKESPEVLYITTSHVQVVTTARQALHTLAALLHCARTRHDVHSALRVAHALSLPRLLHVLCAGFIRAPEGASSGCRVWAVEVVKEVLAVLRGGQLAEEKGKVGGAWETDYGLHIMGLLLER